MKFKLKRFVVFLALLAFACEFPKDGLVPDNNKLAEFRKVGHEIALEQGMRWIEHYKANRSASGRTVEESPYSIPSFRLNAMLGSVDNLVGVTYHYGLDSYGTRHIIAVPIDATLTIFGDASQKLIIDANSGSYIDASTAEAWTAAYKDANPNSVWYHFFGENVFNDILSILFLTELNIVPATNDADGSPQLLMIIWNDLDLLNGREADEEPGRVYDASNPCPSFCGKENGTDLRFHGIV